MTEASLSEALYDGPRRADVSFMRKKSWRSRNSGGSGDVSMCPVTIHELCTTLR